MKKKSMATLEIIPYLFGLLMVVIFLGIAIYSFQLVSSSLNQDVDIGQTNLADVNALTFGKMTNAFVSNADNIGLAIIIGMSLLMILNAFLLSLSYPKVFIILDILILVFAFILAVYISQAYSTYINGVSGTIDVYVDNLPKSSAFVLNLPSFVATLGAIIIIISYSGIGRENQETNVGVYQ